MSCWEIRVVDSRRFADVYGGRLPPPPTPSWCAAVPSGMLEAEAQLAEGCARKGGPMRILVATDGSLHALRAARVAARLARDLRQTDVIIVSVLHLTEAEAITVGATAAFGYVDGVDMLDEVESDAERASAAAAALFEGCDATVTRRHPRGAPAAQIVETARAVEADIIVVGRRGFNQTRELLVGSVSQQVLQAAPCPVLIVP